MNNVIRNNICFVFGAYCGTYYDLKPYFTEAREIIIKNIPRER